MEYQINIHGKVKVLHEALRLLEGFDINLLKYNPPIMTELIFVEYENEPDYCCNVKLQHKDYPHYIVIRDVLFNEKDTDSHKSFQIIDYGSIELINQKENRTH